MGISKDITREAVVIEGVLVVKKEAGWTSHDVVAKVRRLLGGIRVGHVGTLDPAARGVLPLLIGRATRIAEYLVEWDKEYHAVLRLGETTDTQDATGRVLAQVDTSTVSDQALREMVTRFRGKRRQLPPMYSAVKIGGLRLYQAARAGKVVDRTERTIVVHELEILAIDGRDVTLRVVCSKGTYIRTLCADIGRALGVGGHLYALERRRVGPLSIDLALTVEQLAEQVAIGTVQRHLITLDHVLDQLPVVVLTAEEARRVLNGGAVSPMGVQLFPSLPEPTAIRLKDTEGQLLAIGNYDARTAGLIKIRKVLGDNTFRK